MQVDFQQEKGRIQVRIRGHAGYAPAGEDIVCAAASMLGALLEDTLLRENTRGGLRALSVQKSSGVLELDSLPYPFRLEPPIPGTGSSGTRLPIVGRQVSQLCFSGSSAFPILKPQKARLCSLLGSQSGFCFVCIRFYLCFFPSLPSLQIVSSKAAQPRATSS